MSNTERLETALALHRAGQLEQAAPFYAQILQEEPDSAPAMHLLGLVEHQRKRYEAALSLIERAVAINPAHAAYRSNLGNVLRELGRSEEAIESLRKAVELDPALVDGLSNLGALLRAKGELNESLEWLEKARALAPAHSAVQNNLGSTLVALQKPAEAIQAFRAALAIDPRNAEAARNLGAALIADRTPHEAAAWLTLATVTGPEQPDAYAYLGIALNEGGRPQDAIRMLERSCALPFSNGLMHNVLGSVLSERKHYDAAEKAYRRAIELDPATPAPLNNLGITMLHQRRFDEALEVFRKTREMAPEDAGSYIGVGSVFTSLGNFEAAVEEFRQAIERKSDAYDAHLNLGLTLLTLGKLREGWQEYEYRTRLKNWTGANGPRWKGEDLAGGTLLVWPEQGAGDNIHFLRYLAMVREEYMEARMVFPVPEALRRLFKPALDMLRIDTPPQGSDVVITGFQIPLLSLPGLFDTSLEDIPAKVPYLRVDPALERLWRVRLARLPGLKVGLTWAGNRDYAGDFYRSIALEMLAPLLQTPGVSFVSLQTGAEPGKPSSDVQPARMTDWMAQVGDFADTAALISQLDLVISVDTSVAHLAGAMGTPVWLLNRLNTDWRWLTSGPRCAWYPSMTILRQATLGDWLPVIEAARQRLIDCLSDRAYLLPPASAQAL